MQMFGNIYRALVCTIVKVDFAVFFLDANIAATAFESADFEVCPVVNYYFSRQYEQPTVL